MEHLNSKPQYPLKLIYENNGFEIWQGPNVKDFGPEINRADAVFYIKTNGQVRYAKADVIKALEFIFINMVYESERDKVRDVLRKTFQL